MNPRYPKWVTGIFVDYFEAIILLLQILLVLQGQALLP